MPWGTIELEQEVEAWLLGLPDELFGQAERYIDLLAMEIHELREKRGLSQRELAERLGTTPSAVARLEAGNVSPSLPTLDKVAEALGVELVVSFVDLHDRIAG